MEETILDQAILFAVKAHAGATRRDGHTPYILHCTETAAIAATMTADLEILAAAVLHDVIEDTDVTAADLQKAFGERITQLVVTLSENKRGWYYTRLEQALSCLSTTAAFQEFCRLRQELFTS